MARRQLRNSNPFFTPRAFAFSGPQGAAPDLALSPAGVRTGGGPRALTIDGVVGKAAVLLALLVLSAGVTWARVISDDGVDAAALPLAIGAALVGLVLALVTGFRPAAARFTAPAYALVEGVLVGAISGIYAFLYDGVVPLAVGLTFGVLAVLLALYRARVIRVTERFRSVVVAATGAIFLVYLVNLVLGLFGVSVPFLHQTGPIGIGISLVIVAVAALNLLLDFDFIERSARAGADARLEWFAAFGLLVTLVWLYLEILRLLALLRGDD